MKKHILIISQYFYPEQFRINDIATEWVKRGYRVTVLTGIPNYPEGRFFKGYGWLKKTTEEWNGVEIIRIPLIARGKTSVGMVFNYLSFVISGYIWKCFTKIKADVVFTYEVSPMTQALIGVWYAKKRKVPNYLYVQDLWPDNVEMVTGIHSRIIIEPIAQMVRYIYRNCDMIFAISPSFVTEIRKYLPNRAEKVRYWPQYAEDFYRPTGEKSERIPCDTIFNITFTGNIGSAQGLEILPKAAKRLKQQGIWVRFNIVGEGRNKASLLQVVEEYGVASYFNFIERQPATEIPAILAASDVAFLSFADYSLFANTIPAKLQSYMACAMPILAAASGETKRIIEEAECGYCCDVADDVALSDLIIKIMSSDLEQMSICSRRYFEEHFQKKNLMDEMDDILSH